ncbi:MAG: hypothetical protein ABMA15_00375 [Vicinamibacterales bacterium]
MPPKPKTKAQPVQAAEPFVPDEDRRVATRLKPHEVPWIREVKPISGDRARLLNISKTGVLLETTARLQPGRRSTVVIVDGADRKERAEGHVIRTELVSIGPAGELIYRTAMAFAEELDLRLPEVMHDPVAASLETPTDVTVEGPLHGLLSTASGSQRVTVTHVSQAGCYVQSTQPSAANGWASVTVFFSPVRSLTLSGTVVAVEEDRGCLLRFDDLSPETRRALRVEIRESLAVQAPLNAPPSVSIGLITESADQGAVVVEWHSEVASLHANQW